MTGGPHGIPPGDGFVVADHAVHYGQLTGVAGWAGMLGCCALNGTIDSYWNSGSSAAMDWSRL
ncbi:MAG: hypothetical protein R2873_10610 [Caldilineaceae bacterium]